MKYMMGIDLGTSSVKVIISDLNGIIRGEGQEAYELLNLYTGWAEQSPEVWWECTVRAIAQAMSALKEGHEQIAGIGLSGQMHGMVALDWEGNPLRNAIIWADQRSEDEIRSLYERVNREELAKISLNAVAPGFLAASLLWMKDKEAELFGKIKTVIFPKDYIRYRLTGKLGTDRTDASGSGIFDSAGSCWPELLSRIGLPAEILPAVYESQEIAGEVTGEAARQTGLRCGTLVVYGGGDTPMHALGNGLISPGMLSVNIGTAGQIAGCVNQPCYDAGLRTNTFCLPAPNRWMLVGASLNGGIALDWMKNRILQIPDYKQMDEMAASAPLGSGGLYFLPYLLGERTPHMDTHARGVLFGLQVGHERGSMMRAVMEGVAFALKEALEAVESVAVFGNQIIASGGGARSRVFLQMQADIFKKEIHCTDVKAEAGIGACITAAVGLGFYPDFSAACSAMVGQGGDIYIPDEKNNKNYQERFEIFKEIYQKNKDLFKKL